MNEIIVFVFDIEGFQTSCICICDNSKLCKRPSPHCPHQDALAWLVFLVLVHCCCWITFTFPSWILFGKLGCEILAITMLFGKIGCEIFFCGNLACEIGKIDRVMFAIEILFGKLDCWTFATEILCAVKLDEIVFAHLDWVTLAFEITLGFDISVTFDLEIKLGLDNCVTLVIEAGEGCVLGGFRI